MKIALIVDNPQRDLLGMVYLARELTSKNNDVFLVPSNLRFYELGKISPDYVLLPNLRWHNIKLANFLSSKNVKIGVLETEGAFVDNLNRFVNAYSKDIDYNKIVNNWFFWGNEFKNEFTSNLEINEDKYTVVGNPKFDVYKDSKVTKQNQEILIATNFPYFNSNLNMFSETFSRLKDGYYLNNKNLKDNYNYQKLLFNKTLELVNGMSNKYPDHNFTLRPHPFENLNKYKWIISENVKVDNSELSHVALSRSRLLIHFVSSLAFEASLMQINNVVVKNLIKKETLNSNNALLGIINFVESSDALVDGLNNLMNYEDNKDTTISKFIHFDQKYSSSEIISKIINENTVTNISNKDLGSLKFGIANNDRFSGTKYFIRNLFNLDLRLSLRFKNRVDIWKNSYKYFNLENVIKIQDNYSEQLLVSYFDDDSTSIRFSKN
tara:strand:+ start:8646 stop:9956 length:1311 start_codon:yes stop_codon:yes gene_type:complete